ncbi:hypothetical protein EXIGLDRAFT_684827 [Exidia glandulosa HHB12029]|uniref:Uncharacterized protein n=2 Tax=Exidia glandulosa HHB12029 TaxID=1314781 RepID=A0A165CH68_EXIGL|nr:hypothetical protein EXIGLDRAFT_684827 [Exidia glandulosa HHB12029]
MQLKEALNLSFSNARELRQTVQEIPSPAPFQRTELTVPGLDSTLHVLHRDTAECLRLLWARLNLLGKVSFAPERHWTDETRTHRKYSAYHTGDHMWRVQTEIPAGGTVVSVIFFVDKTQLCQLVGVGDNQAYPIYMTLANIATEARLDVSSGAYILVGYLPTTSFDDCDLPGRVIRSLRLQIFHAAVRTVFAPLRAASHVGMELTSADGSVRMGYPVLAIGGLDHPEQCQHALARFGRACPKCDAKKDDFSTNSMGTPRDPAETLRHLRHAMTLDTVTAVNDYLQELGLNFVDEPYWEGWAHVDIHEAIAPDILHQMYQGMLKHLVLWVGKLVGEKELDARLKRVSPFFGLRHFEHGISKLQRVSGTEHKAIAAQLLACVASANVDKRVVRATRALLDFIQIAQFKCHSDETLSDLQRALDDFFENAPVFVELKVCESLDLPKMHSMQHFIPSIRLFGEANAYNTELGERLHIDFAKDAYDATNKKKDSYLMQMCLWLECRERMNDLGHWLAHRRNTTFDPRKRAPDKTQHEPIEYTKKPGNGICTFPELATTHYGAGLREAVNEFLDTYCYAEWKKKYPRVPPPTFPHARSYHTVAVWNNMKFYTPDVQTVAAKDTRDVAYALPQRARRTSRDPDDAGLAARFSPVFIKKGEAAGDGGTAGLRIAHLRVIFELPDKALARLEELHIEDPGKLAFVQWFTRLGRRDVDSTMFKVSRETQYIPGQGSNTQRRVSVIEASDIRRSCHLVPRLGRDTTSIPRDLTSDNILEEWEGEFWVNHWVDKPMYRSLL